MNVRPSLWIGQALFASVALAGAIADVPGSSDVVPSATSACSVAPLEQGRMALAHSEPGVESLLAGLSAGTGCEPR